MMTSINFETRPTVKEIKDKWKVRLDSLKGASVPFKQSAIYLDRWVQLNFKNQGDSVGGWRPLAAGGRWINKNGKRYLDTSAKILIDTSALRHSFTPWATNREAGIKSDLPYAIKHEEGRDDVPARRMLPKRREVISEINQIFHNFIRTSMRK